MVMLSETLLDVASFFDYATLVMLRLSNKQLLRFADRYAEQLAFRRTFSVTVSCRRWLPAQQDQVSVVELRADGSHTRVHTVELDAADNERLSVAMAELNSLIGPHAVYDVDLENIPFSAKLLVDHVPALRHASEIGLSHASGFSPSLQAYTEIVSLFQRPTRIWLRDIPIEALVAFLQSACSSQLKDWSAFAPRAEENADLVAAQEDVIFRSFDLSNLDQGEPKHFMFEGWNLRWDFLRGLIEAADSLQRLITIEVSKPDWVHAERLDLEDASAVTYWRLPLDPTSFEEKSVAIIDFLQQRQHQQNPWTKIAYFSKQSDLVVFIRGDTITITNNPSHIDFAESFGDILL